MYVYVIYVCVVHGCICVCMSIYTHVYVCMYERTYVCMFFAETQKLVCLELCKKQFTSIYTYMCIYLLILIFAYKET